MLIKKLTEEQYLTVKMSGLMVSYVPDNFWYVSASEVTPPIKDSVVYFGGKPFLPITFHRPSKNADVGWMTVLAHIERSIPYRLFDQPSLFDGMDIEALQEHRDKVEDIFSKHDILFLKTSIFSKLDYYPIPNANR